MMKRILMTLAVVLLAGAAAKAQDALPQTKLTFDAEAVQEHFHAGPYARYAKKYLGIDAKDEDAVSYRLTGVSMSYSEEASGQVSWSAPIRDDRGFAGRGVSSNLTSEAAVLYSEGSSGRISISQNMVVEKSADQKAKEAAETIFALRKSLLQILTGDTDASYGGEAMQAAIDELSRLENEYLTLFIGYSEYQTQHVSIDITPGVEMQGSITPLFKLSDTEGFLTPDEAGGRTYYLDIAPESLVKAPFADPKAVAKAKSTVIRRIPALCTVKLSDGQRSILQGTIPISQFGEDRVYPL